VCSSKVRLRDKEVLAIQQAFSEFFLPHDHLWVFGSRADLDQKGGDIDLYIETSLDSEKVVKMRSAFKQQICKSIGDQKIDVVVRLLDSDVELAIYKVAKEEGVQIV